MIKPLFTVSPQVHFRVAAVVEDRRYKWDSDPPRWHPVDDPYVGNSGAFIVMRLLETVLGENVDVAFYGGRGDIKVVGDIDVPTVLAVVQAIAELVAAGRPFPTAASRSANFVPPPAVLRALAGKPPLIAIRTLVSCRDANGKPTFCPVVVNCTRHEYDAGEHYKAAKNAAERRRYESIAIVYNEYDGPALLFAGYDWTTAATADVETEGA